MARRDPIAEPWSGRAPSGSGERWPVRAGTRAAEEYGR